MRKSPNAILLTLICLLSTLATVVLAVGTEQATGTFAQDAAGIMAFDRPVTEMLCLTNHGTATAYFRLYRNYEEDVDTTVSRRMFDIALDTSETCVLGRDVLGRSGITDVGVYGPLTSSTQLMVTGK